MNRMEWRGLDCIRLAQFRKNREHGDKSLCSINCLESLNYLRNYWVIKKNSIELLLLLGS